MQKVFNVRVFEGHGRYNTKTLLCLGFFMAFDTTGYLSQGSAAQLRLKLN